MIAIIDYGMGNLRSVQKAFEKAGAETVVTQKASDIKAAQKIVLPGVGAMRPAMEKLTELGLIPVIKNVVNENKPFFGICLGFQILFEVGYEGGKVEGLGILKGSVEKFTKLKVPQMGWNQLNISNKNCAIFKNIPDQSNVYFCHSYYVKPKDQSIIATTTNYGIDYCSSICSNNIFGVQFHPEKSQEVGLEIIKNFISIE
ncbi:MAG: imidazole glycerol phosphate synthase subunit HisH [Candidatus Omnitrophica bacterium]|nr:imidazole glycerol phosphate synthase subunit HisH [Candidatus Omnitrophota bacterium]